MNDPVEIHEERVVSGGTVVPGSTVVPGAVPVAAVPMAAAPMVAAPVAAGTGTYASRTGVYPVGYRAMQIIWFIVGLLNIILAFDFFFRILKANDAGFASAVYAVGGVLGAPFDSIFNVTTFRGDAGVGIIRWSDLLAMGVYSLVGWGATKVVRISNTPRDVRGR